MVYKGLDKSSIAGCVRMTSLKELHCIARKRPIRPANAEIRHDYGPCLVVTTPTAHRGFCIVFSGVVLGLAGRGIITAEAVMLFSSSLRCGSLRRVAPPMRWRAS